MPTILLIKGWRLYFWANESNEPIHVHAEKGDMECKFWLIEEEFEIRNAFEYNLSPQARREIKKIIYETF
jgi:Ni,Fe-hydrogenase maturation factor